MSDDERIALALTALAEVTDPGSIGALVGATVPEPGVIDLRFATTQPGYAGWFWTVSTSALDGVEPTVIELELLPGDGALVAPSWVPWEERLADWRRSHGDAADEGAIEDDDDLEDDDDEVDDLDDSDADLDDGSVAEAEVGPDETVAASGAPAEEGLDRVVDEVLDDGDVAGVDVDASAASGPADETRSAPPRRRRRRAQRP